MIKRKFSEIAMALSLALILAAPPASVLAGDYKLGVSDQVKIKVQEWPDLAGEYTVTADGVVSLPLIGNIDVAGLHSQRSGTRNLGPAAATFRGRRAVLAAVEISSIALSRSWETFKSPVNIRIGRVLRCSRRSASPADIIDLSWGPPAWPRLAVANGDINSPISQAEPADRARSATNRGDRWTRGCSPAAGTCEAEDDPEITAIMKDEQAALALESEMKRIEQAGLESIKSLYQNRDRLASRTGAGSRTGEGQYWDAAQGTARDGRKRPCAFPDDVCPRAIVCPSCESADGHGNGHCESQGEHHVGRTACQRPPARETPHRNKGSGEDKRRYCRRARKNHDGNAGAWEAQTSGAGRSARAIVTERRSGQLHHPPKGGRDDAGDDGGRNDACGPGRRHQDPDCAAVAGRSRCVPQLVASGRSGTLGWMRW